MEKTKGTAVYECLRCGYVFVGEIDDGEADIAYDASEGQKGRALKIEYRCHICNTDGQVGFGKLKMFYTNQVSEKFWSGEDLDVDDEGIYIPILERKKSTE
ncbi:hypothetical protein MSMAT_1717 [Methanosarcina mazei TMA]|uniref:hypothetical protein n=1 Tax=Methanosarcina mazei TaxID=2209 RepID=UPI0006D46FC4|nr:hypothetical protein [Methanosarcina mazei]UWJ22974.1 hypothetical protein MSMAT_1717 [Methanosarcina mazei TMA]BBL65705.1 hypothetical protein MmazTMA_26820 [Methanosarcina mazei]